MDLLVKLTLTEEMLGTASANPELYRTYLANGRDEETETLPPIEDEMRNGTTVFHRDADGCPMLYDYQIKGFFKDACSALRRADDTASAKLKAHIKIIDGTIFVSPRRIRITLPAGGKIGICERPLRAQTAQGERVALARSESVPAGSTLEFIVTLMSKDTERALVEWLEYGRLRGLGQWRNSGKGRFSFEKVK